jgi:hypothetical protein
MPNVAQLLAGRDPYGSSGGDIMNMLAQLRAGGQLDPMFARYIQGQDTGDGTRYGGRRGSGVNGQGAIERNGVQYVQVGGIPDDGRILDHTQVEYDPEFGAITPIQNVHVEESALDRYMPLILAAGFGGPAIGAAMAGGEGAAIGAGFGATGGGSAGIGAGLAGGGAIDAAALGGAAAASGAAGGGSAALPDSYWSQLANSGGVVSDAGPSGALDLGGSAGFDVTGGGSIGAGAGTPNSTGGGWLDSLITGAQNNPMGTARGALGLASVLAGASGSHAPGSAGDVSSIIEQMANSNRVNQTTPFGSRTWSQGRGWPAGV